MAASTLGRPVISSLRHAVRLGDIAPNDRGHHLRCPRMRGSRHRRSRGRQTSSESQSALPMPPPSNSGLPRHRGATPGRGTGVVGKRPLAHVASDSLRRVLAPGPGADETMAFRRDLTGGSYRRAGRLPRGAVHGCAAGTTSSARVGSVDLKAFHGCRVNPRGCRSIQPSGDSAVPLRH